MGYNHSVYSNHCMSYYFLRQAINVSPVGCQGNIAGRGKEMSKRDSLAVTRPLALF